MPPPQVASTRLRAPRLFRLWRGTLLRGAVMVLVNVSARLWLGAPCLWLGPRLWLGKY